LDVEGLEAQLREAAEHADETYQTYIKAMEKWPEEAPICTNATCVPATVRQGEDVLPSISFAFRGGTEAPITVTLTGKEFDLRKFRTALDGAITHAVRAANQQRKGL
jgi:hypothetical protein